jgi:hypothetical protein
VGAEDMCVHELYNETGEEGKSAKCPAGFFSLWPSSIANNGVNLCSRETSSPDGAFLWSPLAVFWPEKLIARTEVSPAEALFINNPPLPFFKG